MKVWILRLGHRLHRDERMSTHCGLVARAFGGDGIIYSGDKDESLMNSIKKIVENWGGPFHVSYEKDWEKVIKEWKGKVINLTMYGLPIKDKMGEIRGCKQDLLVVVGGKKVSSMVYELSDWNIAVTNQPHSEVAALAVFLDYLFEKKELKKKFKNAKIKIVPQEKGKKTISL